METDPRIRRTVVRILQWLVERDYGAIEFFTRGVRMSTSDIHSAVTEYGRNLTMLPTSALDNLDVIEIEDAHPRAWSVRVDLWTEEEGRSDLSMECTLIDQPGEHLKAELDGIHVL